MKWYEIIGLIVVWLIGLYVTGKFYEHLRNRHYNDSWRKRERKREKMEGACGIFTFFEIIKKYLINL